MATKENPEMTKEETERFWKSMTNGEESTADGFWKYLLPNNSPPSEIQTIKRIIVTVSEPTNYNNRSYSSGYSGGYYTSGENLNGSSGFSQGGGGHSNFFATVKSWR